MLAVQLATLERLRVHRRLDEALALGPDPHRYTMADTTNASTARAKDDRQRMREHALAGRHPRPHLRP